MCPNRFGYLTWFLRCLFHDEKSISILVRKFIEHFDLDLWTKGANQQSSKKVQPHFSHKKSLITTLKGFDQAYAPLAELLFALYGSRLERKAAFVHWRNLPTGRLLFGLSAALSSVRVHLTKKSPIRTLKGSDWAYAPLAGLEPATNWLRSDLSFLKSRTFSSPCNQYLRWWV